MISAMRWRMKKAARMGMAVGAWAGGLAAATPHAYEEPQVRVLTYHRFGRTARDPFCLDIGDFEKQMRYLAYQESAISFKDLQRFIAGQATLPPRAVVVTIDDGFSSLYRQAFPVLRHYGVPAVAFITAGLIDSQHDRTQSTVQTPEPYLSWDELATLANSQVAIGSHAWSHRSLGRMPLMEAQDEASRSREKLQTRLGVPVEAFAYPFGTLADFNDDTKRILALSGYRYAFTSQHGAVQRRMDSFTLPRIKVESGEPLWMFRLLVCGGLDGWRHIDRTLWRLQMSR